jgi:hypothetical protein
MVVKYTNILFSKVLQKIPILVFLACKYIYHLVTMDVIRLKSYLEPPEAGVASRDEPGQHARVGRDVSDPDTLRSEWPGIDFMNLFGP